VREPFDDDAARRALHTLTDEPAPPVSTSFDEVLRRGRRRVLVQRVSAVASAVVVVAGIGVGAMVLRPDDQGGGVEVGTSAGPSSVATTPPWADLPGWELAELPAGVAVSSDSCVQARAPQPPELQATEPSGNSVLPEDLVSREFYSVVKEVIRTPAAVTSDWQSVSPGHPGSRGYVAVEVGTGRTGTGRLQLEAGLYGGTPTQAADASITAYANCVPPLRRTLHDGSVLQLYPVNHPDTPAPTQPLVIYRPDGREYVVTSIGTAQADGTVVQGGEAPRTEGVRGELPTTEVQLATIAVLLVRALA
jgi:hypothetical protein